MRCLQIKRGDNDVVFRAIGAVCVGRRPLPRHRDRHRLVSYSVPPFNHTPTYTVLLI